MNFLGPQGREGAARAGEVLENERESSVMGKKLGSSWSFRWGGRGENYSSRPEVDKTSWIVLSSIWSRFKRIGEP